MCSCFHDGTKQEWCENCDAPRRFIPDLLKYVVFHCEICGWILKNPGPQTQEAITGIDEYKDVKGRTHRTIVIGYKDSEGKFVLEKEIKSVWKP